MEQEDRRRTVNSRRTTATATAATMAGRTEVVEVATAGTTTAARRLATLTVRDLPRATTTAAARLRAGSTTAAPLSTTAVAPYRRLRWEAAHLNRLRLLPRWGASHRRQRESASARVVGVTSRKPSCPSLSREAFRRRTWRTMPVRPSAGFGDAACCRLVPRFADLPVALLSPVATAAPP